RPVSHTHTDYFYSIIPLLPTSTLFPYTTLFRSCFTLVINRSVNGITEKSHDAFYFLLAIQIYSKIRYFRRQFHQRNQLYFDHQRSEEHTSELQSPYDLVCRLLLEKKKKQTKTTS